MPFSQKETKLKYEREYKPGLAASMSISKIPFPASAILLLARMTAPSLCLIADSTTTSILPKELPSRSETRTRTFGEASDTEDAESREMETGTWNLFSVRTFNTSSRWKEPFA